MTNTLNTPAEALELQYPLRVRRFERVPNTGGSGTHTGGDGIIRELEALAPCEGTVITDRRMSRPYGLQGGAAGTSGKNDIRRANLTVVPLTGKSLVKLDEGDVLRITTPGGGGWGNR
jgi:N-methylhydantoinase B